AAFTHFTMTAIFGAVSVFVLAAMAAGFVRFSTESGKRVLAFLHPRALRAAFLHALTLKYLDKAGGRRWFHHLTFYGFLLCFAATSVAAVYHYLLAREAPYPWWDLPVVLGTLGGIGLVVGPIGLFMAKSRRAPELLDE